MCIAAVRWDIVPDGEVYVVRYGIAPRPLNHNLEIRGSKEIALHHLNAEAAFTVLKAAKNK